MAQTSVEDFDRLVAVDARAPFLMMRAASGALADGGRVVNISSGVTSTVSGPFGQITAETENGGELGVRPRPDR